MRKTDVIGSGAGKHPGRTRKLAEARAKDTCIWCGSPLTDSVWRGTKSCSGCETKHRGRIPAHRKAPFRAIGIDGEGQTGKCLTEGCECIQFQSGTDDPVICECGHRRIARSVHDEEYHEHKYVLLGIGDFQIWNDDGSELSSWQIFAALWSQFTLNPKNTVYVGFWLGYDFTNWLKQSAGIEWNRAKSLLDASDSTYKSRHKASRKGPGKNGPPLPVQVTPPSEFECPMRIQDGGETWQWQIDVMTNFKRFKLRPQPCACRKASCQHVKGIPWMFINDTGSFFQTSLMRVIDPEEWEHPIVSDDEWEILKTGKDSRDVAVLDDDMRRYNRLENEVLARLITKLDEGFKAMGIELGRGEWFSPGQPASKWLSSIGAVKYKDLIKALPKGLMDAARSSYMAGWWHTAMVGHAPAVTYMTDINSAYPDAYAKLPCIGAMTADGLSPHGEWMHVTFFKSPLSALDIKFGALALVHAHVIGENSYVGSMLHRTKDGRIARPDVTGGWYWYHELDAACKAGLISELTIYETWVFIPGCDCPPPLRGIRELYEQRLRVGKNTPMGKAAKLVYNSAYGKTAQSVGLDADTENFPPFLNWIYASLITAECRIKILNAIETHQDGTKAVLMIATDSVLWASEHRYLRKDDPEPDPPYEHLKISKGELGKWSYEVKDHMTILKPGFYWDDETRDLHRAGKDVRVKSRGVSPKDFANSFQCIDEQFDGWRGPNADGTGWPQVSFSVGFNQLSPKQSIRQNKWEDSGKITSPVLTVTSKSNIEVKCNPGFFDERLGIYRLIPISLIQLEPYCECPLKTAIPHSYPYKPELGPAAQIADGQRDEHYGYSDDGPVNAQIVWAMGDR